MRLVDCYYASILANVVRFFWSVISSHQIVIAVHMGHTSIGASKYSLTFAVQHAILFCTAKMRFFNLLQPREGNGDLAGRIGLLK